MSTEALARALTVMLNDGDLVAEVKKDAEAALAAYDLDAGEIGLLSAAAVEGVDSIGEDHGDAMKAVAAAIKGDADAVSPETMGAMIAAVREKMMAQLARADIMDPRFAAEGEDN
jgi:hypothetical protein